MLSLRVRVAIFLQAVIDTFIPGFIFEHTHTAYMFNSTLDMVNVIFFIVILVFDVFLNIFNSTKCLSL